MKKVFWIITICILSLLIVQIGAADAGSSFDTAITITDFYRIPVENVGTSGRYFQFTAPVTTTYRIETSGNNTLYKGIYDAKKNERLFTSGAAEEGLKLSLTAGSKYYIHTGSAESASASISYNLYISYETEVGDYSVTAYTNDCIIDAYNGTKTSVILPETLQGMKPMLGPNAFSSNTTLTAVEIPGIYNEVIGFSGCTKLSDVILHEGIQIIGSGAFEECVSLAKLDLPESITTIDDDAFRKCSALEQLVIPEAVETFGSNTFRNCSALKSINIPSGIISIPSSCFYGCASIVSLDIPNSVIEIGIGAFRDCTGLTQAVVPAQVTSVGSSAFRNCSSLVVLAFLSRDAKIGSNCFMDCVSLTIYGYSGSTIEAFAVKNGISFEAYAEETEPDEEETPAEPDTYEPDINIESSYDVYSGFTVFKPIYEKINAFYDGYATVYTEGHVALIDSSNVSHYISDADALGNYTNKMVAAYDAEQKIITFTRLDGYAFSISDYIWAGDFIGGKCAVFHKDGYYQLIDSSGTFLITEPCEEILYNGSNTVFVLLDNVWQAVQLQNNGGSVQAVSLAADFEIYNPELSATGEHIICSDGNAYGILNLQNKPITAFKYDAIFDADNGLFAAYYGTYVDLIDSSGNITSSINAYYVGEYSSGVLPCFDGSGFQYIDKTGYTRLYVLEDNVVSADTFNEGYAVVTVEGKGYTYIDTSGRFAVNQFWDYAERFANGYALVMNMIETEDGLCKMWFILDDSFSVVMQLEDEVYIDISDAHSADFSNGYIRTINIENGKMGFIYLNVANWLGDTEDINGSGTVTIDDALYMLRYTILPGRYQPYKNSMDYDKSNTVDAKDAAYLYRSILSRES